MPEAETKYADADLIRQKIAEGRHRMVIGGLWEELGQLQRDFLIARGVRPEHRVIDIGCGSLRAGVPLTRYLEPGNYYGIDLREELLEAGYEREIRPAGLAGRLPRGNLRATGDFDLSGFGATFDAGIAQSVFTHIPRGELTRCLLAAAPWFAEGAALYATYFERPADHDPAAPVRHPAGVETWPDRDPFDMTLEALAATAPAGWRLEVIGEWGHPRDQRMAAFIRTGDAADGAR